MSGQCGGRERTHFEVSKVTEFGNEEDIPDPQRERKPADLVAHSPTVMTNILTRCHNNGPEKISRYIHPTVASRSCGGGSAETTGEVIPPTDRPFHAYERSEKQPYSPLSGQARIFSVLLLVAPSGAAVTSFPNKYKRGTKEEGQ